MCGALALALEVSHLPLTPIDGLLNARLIAPRRTRHPDALPSQLILPLLCCLQLPCTAHAPLALPFLGDLAAHSPLIKELDIDLQLPCSSPSTKICVSSLRRKL
jgi:hypothetical protein